MKKIITVIIIVLVLVGSYFLLSQKPTSIGTDISNSELVLFYGETCPHCKNVESFISQNQIDLKLKIEQLEIYNNKSNRDAFQKSVTDICPEKIDKQGLPVPFLINQKDKKCILGEDQIKEYLTEKSK